MHLLTGSIDEKIYIYQANVIREGRIEGINRLICQYKGNKTLWFFPPPTRIGYSYLLAGVMKFSGIHNEMAGAYISAFASIGSIFLLVFMGLRFFNPWVTLVALLGIVVSPMDLAIARRCWQDSLLGFIGTLYIYFCAELTVRPKRKLLYIPILITGSYCMLIKESGVVIFGLGLAWLLWQAIFKEKSFSRSLLTFATGIAGVAISLILLAKICGGFSNIVEVLKDVKGAMAVNEYALKFQTGPWYRIVEGFWILTPVFTSLAFFGCAATFSKNIKNNAVIRMLSFFVIAFIAIAVIIPNCQNIRYLSALFIPFYLLAGLGLWFVVILLKERSGRPVFSITVILMTIILILAAVNEYKFFQRNFVEEKVPDLSIRFLQECS